MLLLCLSLYCSGPPGAQASCSVQRKGSRTHVFRIKHHLFEILLPISVAHIPNTCILRCPCPGWRESCPHTSLRRLCNVRYLPHCLRCMSRTLHHADVSTTTVLPASSLHAFSRTITPRFSSSSRRVLCSPQSHGLSLWPRRLLVRLRTAKPAQLSQDYLTREHASGSTRQCMVRARSCRDATGCSSP